MVVSSGPRGDLHRTDRAVFPSPASLVILALVMCLVAAPDLCAQNFTRLTIDSDFTYANAASWIDYDNDDDLDLFVCENDFSGVGSFNPTRNQDKLFRNDGNGTFVRILPEDMANDVSFTTGQTWADYDNDGDVDLYIAHQNYIYERFLDTSTELGSALYKNEGPGNDYSLTRIVSGEINGNNRISAFSAAWADYNNDGFVDLFITTPRGIAYPNEDTLRNVLFDNNGNGTFTRNTTSALVNGPIDFYTIPTWSDYDNDGDMDLFVTNGPVQNGVTQPDYFYQNRLQETGTATFERDLTTNFAAEARDGQQANWIDYDNDSDLDLYITNFGGSPGQAFGATNDFYRNDGGTFTKITTGEHVTDAKISLGQTWGDFDNDGDLDLYVTNLTSTSSSGGNDYYQNEGPPDYTFTRIPVGDFVGSPRSGWAASSGDYDNDGDLDLYTTFLSLTAGEARDALYRNDLDNGNHWINIKAVGTTSNKSAIGAKIRVKATISGNSHWQMREISAQNAATGQNSLRVHVGLGDAAVVDSLRIEWPSGTIDVHTNVDVDQFLVATEGQTVSPVHNESGSVLPDAIRLYQNYPNPFNQATMLRFELPAMTEVDLHVFDLLGRRVATLVEGEVMRAGVHEAHFEATGGASSSVYVVRLRAGSTVSTQTMILLR